MKSTISYLITEASAATPPTWSSRCSSGNSGIAAQDLQRVVDHRGVRESKTLFGMIKTTHGAQSGGDRVAYADQRRGDRRASIARFLPGIRGALTLPGGARPYADQNAKPTTTPRRSRPSGGGHGSGGELRDEAATGAAQKPRRDCAVSRCHLCIPDFEQPWEKAYGRPGRVASPCSHARGAGRRGFVQQRIRRAQFAGLLSCLRDGSRRSSSAATTSDHDRGDLATSTQSRR